MTIRLRTSALLFFCGAVGACNAGSPAGTATTLQVVKGDSSVQCESPGMPAEIMARQLTEAGITVLCAQKGHDGRMRAAQCGMATGQVNVFVIPAQQRAQAEQLGFQAASELPGFPEQPCR